MRKYIIVLIACCLSLIAPTALPNVVLQKQPSIQTLLPSLQLREFKLQPRFNLWGITGSNTLTAGQVLFPLYTNDANDGVVTIPIISAASAISASPAVLVANKSASANAITNKRDISNRNSLRSNFGVIFGLVEGDVTVQRDGTWFAGAGVGYRHIINDNIYGGYLIVDYNRSPKNNSFWIANPGIEVLGNTWDYGVNAYFPLYNKKQNYRVVKWGEDFGISDYIQYTAHKGYDRYMQQLSFESAGTGVDCKIGRTLPHLNKAKAYVGGYYFRVPDANPIVGVSAKFTYELSKYTAFEISHSYDNHQRHRTLLGIKLTLNGYSNSEQKTFGLASRLLDSIDHAYGATTVPITLSTGQLELVDSTRRLRYDNLWFIREGKDSERNSDRKGLHSDASDSNDGTYEHPFIGFNQDSASYIVAHSGIGVINVSPILYFASGTYSLASFKGLDGLAYKWRVPAGWSIYGRSMDYVHRAYGDARPVLVGGLDFAPQEEVAKKHGIGNNQNYRNERSGGSNNNSDNSNDSGRNNSDSANNSASNSSPSAGNNTIDSVRLREIGGAATEGRGAGIVTIINAQNVNLCNVKIGDDSFVAGGYYTGIYMKNARDIIMRDVEVHGYNDANHPMFAYGIYAINSNINLVDGVNSITAYNSAPEQAAVGVALFEHTALNLYRGVNNITATSFASGFPLSPAAYGVVAQNAAEINFYDGVNRITAINSVRGDSPTATAIGIAIRYNASVNFYNGKNHIVGYALSDAASGEYSMANAIAMEVDNESTVNLRGGRNTINADSASYGNKSSSDSLGLVALNNSTINLQDGGNVINAVSSAYGIFPHADAVGIKGDDLAIINFQGGSNAINSFAAFSITGYVNGGGGGRSGGGGGGGGGRSGGGGVSGNGSSGDGASGGVSDSGGIGDGNGDNSLSFMVYDRKRDATSNAVRDAAYGARARGIDVFNEASVNFIGGQNDISVLSERASSDNKTAVYGVFCEAFGVIAFGANVNFAGGDNNFTLHSVLRGAVSSEDKSYAAAYGVAAYSANVNFSGSAARHTNIAVSADDKSTGDEVIYGLGNGVANGSGYGLGYNSGYGSGYGLRNGFVNNGRVANRRTANNTAYGIYADQDAHMNINGDEIQEGHLGDVLNYVNMTRLPVSSSYNVGNKLEWGDASVPWEKIKKPKGAI